MPTNQKWGNLQLFFTAVWLKNRRKCHNKTGPPSFECRTIQNVTATSNNLNIHMYLLVLNQGMIMIFAFVIPEM